MMPTHWIPESGCRGKDWTKDRVSPRVILLAASVAQVASGSRGAVAMEPRWTRGHWEIRNQSPQRASQISPPRCTALQSTVLWHGFAAWSLREKAAWP